MNIINKSFSYVFMILLSSIIFLLWPSVLWNTLLWIPISQWCHSEKNKSTDNHQTNTIEQLELTRCCNTNLCPTGLCCAYVTPWILYVENTSTHEFKYIQKKKIFWFSVITHSILEPPW